MVHSVPPPLCSRQRPGAGDSPGGRAGGGSPGGRRGPAPQSLQMEGLLGL